MSSDAYGHRRIPTATSLFCSTNKLANSRYLGSNAPQANLLTLRTQHGFNDLTTKNRIASDTCRFMLASFSPVSCRLHSTLVLCHQALKPLYRLPWLQSERHTSSRILRLQLGTNVCCSSPRRSDFTGPSASCAYLEGIVGVRERVVFQVILFQVALDLACHDVQELWKRIMVARTRGLNILAIN